MDSYSYKMGGTVIVATMLRLFVDVACFSICRYYLNSSVGTLVLFVNQTGFC